MMDAMGVWDSICSSPWFRTTSLVRISRYVGSTDLHSLIYVPMQILFLNKEDLFRERIQYSPISKFFPVRPLILLPPLACGVSILTKVA